MGLFNSIRLGSSAAGDYEVERSLRFNDNDSAYLQFTPSSTGNRKTWTWSSWVKRSNISLGSQATIFHSYGSGSQRTELTFETDDTLRFAQGTASDNGIVTTTARFRDVSAWYHIVCVADFSNGTAGNRFKLYVNGVEQANTINTAFTDADGQMPTSSVPIEIGGRTSNRFFDGYLAEINFIDGTALTPSSFAKTNPVTGQWIPKKFGGSYGTNGFFLDFSDNSGTTSTTLGKDSSGNGHNFTPNNFSVSAGVGNDSLEDTPTNNFCTLSPLTGNGTQFSTSSNGNLDFSCASGTGQRSHGSMLIPETGKWYAEVVFSSGGQHSSYGILNPIDGSSLVNLEFSTSQEQIRADNSYLESSTESWGNGEILGIKVDRDAGTIQFTVDGTNASTAVNLSEMSNTSQLVFTTSRTEGGGAAVAGSFNFGQRPFSHLPTNYKSLCTANLDDPSIKLPTDHFNTVLYSGDGNSTKSITGVGFQPDWLWLKGRNTSYSNLLYNSVVGAGTGKGLNSNEDRAEGATVADDATYGYLNSFDSDGFSVTKGSDSTSYTNGGSSNYVSWNWKGGGTASSNGDGSITSSVSANTTAGFSCGTFTGTGSNGSIGHGLGVAPSFIVVKSRSHVDNWFVYHKSLGANAYIMLNSNSAADTGNSTVWQNVSPTSSVFYASTGGYNDSGEDLVFYAFSEVVGYSRAGTYVGTGNANGPMVYLGFKPAWILYKATNDGQGWQIHDTSRIGYNDSNYALRPDSGTAEATNVNIDILSNGFKLRNGLAISNGGSVNYAYFAIAESPFKYSRAR